MQFHLDISYILNAEKLSEHEGNSHGQEPNSEVPNHGCFGWGFSKFGTSVTSEKKGHTDDKDSSRDAVFTWENGN